MRKFQILAIMLMFNLLLSQTTNFSYTGSVQTYTVPVGVNEIQIKCWGAQGGTYTNLGGLGGYAEGKLSVTAGQILYAYVGQQPTNSGGGFNGGGAGTNDAMSRGGGGASDIRIGGTALSNRIIVGAGGGGATNQATEIGGAGGGLIGEAGRGADNLIGGGYAGWGGTQSAGGAACTYYGKATPGTFGQGGNSLLAANGLGGGGGGGWYGGGAGDHGGGGGGSSYTGTLTNSYNIAGVRSGDGLITIIVTASVPAYSLNYTAGANGVLIGSLNQVVAINNNGSAVTAVPNPGYRFVNWSDNVKTNPRTDINVTSNINVTANFTANAPASYTNYGFNGGLQIYTVPSGVNLVQLECWGAQGGTFTNQGGLGGYVKGNLNVTPGLVLYIYVGQQPVNSGGGFNGGGAGTNDAMSRGGGGASDIRLNGTVLNDRIIVGAGGGGATNQATEIGGAGGGLAGEPGRGADNLIGGGYAGWGGTQSAGGAACTYYGKATPGTFGQGGNSLLAANGLGGGGGGGWYGGGAGDHGGGGGGSSYLGGVSNGVTVSGAHSGNGYVTVTILATHTLTYSAGENGTLTGTVSQSVITNTSATAVTAVPSSGYHFTNWTINSGSSNGTIDINSNPLIISDVAGDISITANFAANTYTLTYSAGANGTLTGSASQTVALNGSATAVTAVPASGYSFKNWTINSGSGNGTIDVNSNPLTITNVTGNISVTANFVKELAGIYTVGTGGTYTSLTKTDGLFAAINGGIVTGNITANIITDLTEDGSTALNSWLESGVGNYTLNIQSSTTALRTISGDGVNTSSALIKLAGADRVTIDGTSGKYLTFVGNSAKGGYYNVLWLEGSDNCLITNCAITNTNVNNTAVTGILIDGSNNEVSKNKISNINGSPAADIAGIYFSGSSISISNNMISLATPTTGPVSGITVISGTAGVYYNSVYVGGTQSDANNSYGFGKNGTSSLTFKDNVIYNARTNSAKAGSGLHYAVYMPNISGSIDSDYNLLYSAAANTGRWNTSECVTFANWRSTSSLDANSQSSTLTFENISTGDLSFTRVATNAAVFDKGTPIAGITDDYFSKSRTSLFYSQVDIGAYELPQSSDIEDGILPLVTSLSQNYPNPFNPATEINFSLAKAAKVNITVYNAKGEMVKSLINSNLNAGYHSVNFNASGLNSGVYIYKMTTQENSFTRKMIIVK